MYGNETDEVKKEVEAYRKQLAKGNMIKLEGNNEDDDEDDPMDDEAQERMNQQMQLWVFTSRRRWLIISAHKNWAL